MEERVVDRCQKGSLKHLFDKKLTLTNHPGSGNNWAVGHHTHYHEHRSALEEKLRLAAEQCDSLHGILLYMSLGGGTGSGLGTALVRHLHDQFPRVHRLVTCVHPGQYNDVITSPYNVALSLRVLTEHASCVIPVDNKALTDICHRYRLCGGAAPFQEVNGIIVNMLLNLTSSSRFSGSLNCDMGDLATMAPQPGLHYFSASLSPLNLSPQAIINKKQHLLHDVCSREDQLLKVNALGGQLLNAALICRGNISLDSLREYVTGFCAKMKFAKWSNPGVKTGLCSVPPIGQERAMLCLANSTNMSNLFSDSLSHMVRLYRKKAHVHHYTSIDGFEEEDFSLARESLKVSATQYSQAARFVEVPRLKVD